MMLAAASIVIAIALAMVVSLRGSVVSSIVVNGTNMSIAQAIAHELTALSSSSA